MSQKTWSSAGVEAGAGRIVRLPCDCVVRFVDGVTRRIEHFPGIDAYEVDMVEKCVTRNGTPRIGGNCYAIKNRPDQCYYILFHYGVLEPNDALAAELGAKFGA